MNGDVEVGWKYDIVKAVTFKLLRISKNQAVFGLLRVKTIILLRLVSTFAWLTAANSVVEVGWKYDIVNTVTWKLLRILKNPALFQYFEVKTIILLVKKF